MFDFIFRSILLEILGASFKWAVYNSFNWLTGNKYLPFERIYSGRKNQRKSEAISDGISNILWGYLFLAIVIIIMFNV